MNSANPWLRNFLDCVLEEMALESCLCCWLELDQPIFSRTARERWRLGDTWHLMTQRKLQRESGTEISRISVFRHGVGQHNLVLLLQNRTRSEVDSISRLNLFFNHETSCSSRHKLMDQSKLTILLSACAVLIFLSLVCVTLGRRSKMTFRCYWKSAIRIYTDLGWFERLSTDPK